MAIKPLINDKINELLNLLVGKLFEGNRILDRQMSILNIKFVMNKTSDILHPLLAHAFPLLADNISDYQGSRNALTTYLMTPADRSDYFSPLELFIKFLKYMQELETMIGEIIEISKEESDTMTKIFLESFMLRINSYTNQALLLCDKAEAYGDKYMYFDRDIENFIVVSKLSGKG